MCFVCVCVRVCEYEEATQVSTSVWGLRSWQQAASSYSSLTPGSAYYTMFRPPINSQPATCIQVLVLPPLVTISRVSLPGLEFPPNLKKVATDIFRFICTLDATRFLG